MDTTHRLLLFGAALPYYTKILATEPSNLIGFWRQNETAGATAFDLSGQGNDGAYTGVTLANAAGPDGVLVPFWDGANDYNNIYSVGLAADFNGAEGTICQWLKVNTAAVWTDTAIRVGITVGNGVDEISLQKSSTDNQFQYVYGPGGSYEIVSLTIAAPTGWFHVALTWSKVADEMKAFYNGIQTGVTQTTLGNWGNVIANVKTNIGATSTVPQQVWHGWIGPVPIWNKALTPAQILNLAMV